MFRQSIGSINALFRSSPKYPLIVKWPSTQRNRTHPSERSTYTPSRNSIWKWRFRFSALPKRWINVTAPVWAVWHEKPAFLIRCRFCRILPWTFRFRHPGGIRMIRTMLYDRESGHTRFGDEALLGEWAKSPEVWVWADFDDEESAHEAEFFVNNFGLAPLMIADAQRDRHPAKLEAFDDYFFLLMKGLDTATRGIDFGTIQIALFVGERFLVTRRKAKSVSIDSAWAEAKAGNLCSSRGPIHAAYQIVRRVTDRYATIIMEFEKRFDEVQDEMFENPRDELLEELVVYTGNLMKLGRIFSYHQRIFEQLSGSGYPFVGKQERHEFTDVYENTERLTTLSKLYQELTNNLINVYISVNSHHLNKIMKVLTIVTVVFAPLALLVGIYGMNFEDIPELKIENGYFILLGIMAAIAAGLLALFRKLKWV